MRKIRFIASLLIVTLACSAFGQTSRPVDSPDQAGARAAAKDFAAALGQDDLSAAKAKYAGKDEDFQLAEGMHSMLMSAKHFRAAATAKWPDAFADGKNNDIPDAKVLADRLDTQPVTVDGDTATFIGGLTLKKMNGEWKVVDVMAQPKGKDMMAKVVNFMTTAADETATEIEQGKYATFDAAKTAMQAKVRNAVMATMGQAPRTGGPATAPKD